MRQVQQSTKHQRDEIVRDNIGLNKQYQLNDNQEKTGKVDSATLNQEYFIYQTYDLIKAENIGIKYEGFIPRIVNIDGQVYVLERVKFPILFINPEQKWIKSEYLVTNRTAYVFIDESFNEWGAYKISVNVIDWTSKKRVTGTIDMEWSQAT
jgi:hypothetical protein